MCSCKILRKTNPIFRKLKRKLLGSRRGKNIKMEERETWLKNEKKWVQDDSSFHHMPYFPFLKPTLAL